MKRFMGACNRSELAASAFWDTEWGSTVNALGDSNAEYPNRRWAQGGARRWQLAIDRVHGRGRAEDDDQHLILRHLSGGQSYAVSSACSQYLSNEATLTALWKVLSTGVMASWPIT